MTTQTFKSNRAPWIIVGVLGCLALCLFFVLVAGGLYAVVRRTQPTPVARELPTMIAPATSMPLATNVAKPSPIAGGLPTMIAPTTPMPLATTIVTPTTSRTGRIAYIASDPTGDPFKKDAIYLMNADGSQRTLVTDKLSVSNNLLWSPDGTRMVFDARDDTNISVSGMFMANADGTGLNRLTICSQCMVNSPAWSPDGKRIAFQFTSIEPGKPFQGPKLYLMNPDGSQPTPLAGNIGGIRQIAWSPDGKRIALQSSTRCISVVNTTDGSASGPLTECRAAEAMYPAWSIDSKQIVFLYKLQSGGAFALYGMNADGSQQTRLTADLELGQTPPVWSPDGKRIAFSYASKNTGAIGLINPDGSGMLRLTPEDLNAGEPAWTPDGKQIAFSVVTQKPMKADIYVMNADGSGITRLTNDPLNAHSPAWQPSSR